MLCLVSEHSFLLAMGIGCDCLSGDSRFSVGEGNSLGGVKNNSCKLVEVCVEQAQCWAMSLVVVLGLPYG